MNAIGIDGYNMNLETGGGNGDDPRGVLAQRHGGVAALGFDGYNADALVEVHCTVGVNCGMSTGRGGVRAGRSTGA